MFRGRPWFVAADAQPRALLLSSLMSLIVGRVIYEQKGQLRTSFSQLFDFDAGFDAGLSALVRGLAPKP